jgi:hypothetical protein
MSKVIHVTGDNCRVLASGDEDHGGIDHVRGTAAGTQDAAGLGKHPIERRDFRGRISQKDPERAVTCQPS